MPSVSNFAFFFLPRDSNFAIRTVNYGTILILGKNHVQLPPLWGGKTLTLLVNAPHLTYFMSNGLKIFEGKGQYCSETWSEIGDTRWSSPGEQGKTLA